MDFNPYKVLAVDPSADPDVIAAAYRTLSKKYHPDINKTPEAEAKMRDLNRAYDMLKDPDQRRKVDNDLARESTTAPRPGPSATRPQPSSRVQTRVSNWSVGDTLDNLRRKAEEVINDVRVSAESLAPQAPSDKTLYFFQKQLEDKVTHKGLRVAVYHDNATNQKICSVRASAPSLRGGSIAQGEVLLDSERMFDLALAAAECERLIQEPAQPIEMNSDHDVYFRRVVPGLRGNYISLEVIKRTRTSATKEALLILGERNARLEREGVIADQTPTQLQQVSRLFKSALEALR